MGKRYNHEGRNPRGGIDHGHKGNAGAFGHWFPFRARSRGGRSRGSLRPGKWDRCTWANSFAPRLPSPPIGSGREAQGSFRGPRAWLGRGKRNDRRGEIFGRGSPVPRRHRVANRPTHKREAAAIPLANDLTGSGDVKGDVAAMATRAGFKLHTSRLSQRQYQPEVCHQTM